MLNTTIDAIRAVLRMDPTISTPERVKIIYRLKRGDSPKKPEAPAVAKLLRRETVAERLCCSLRTVDKLAVQGLLHKVTLPGRKRAIGFRETDVDALVNGP
jgi:Fe2+ or Zn2+ uptake regulation protein